MNRFYLLMLACIMTLGAFAADVTVTMNETSPTMSLVNKETNEAVTVGEPTADMVYSFSADAGTYVLTAYATDGTTVNGTIELTVTDQEDPEFCIATITAYATNSGWTMGTDYTISAIVAKREGGYETITTGSSVTTGRMTFLMLVGDTYFCDYVPSETRVAEGYATGYKTATMSAATGTASLAIPAGVSYTVSVPTDANFFLGRKTSHYAPFIEIEPVSIGVENGAKTITYNLANSQVYNFRTWKEGGLVNAGYFTASTTASKMPTLAFTDADYETDSPKTIVRDNLSQTGDIMLNINERGHLQMKTGQTYDVTGLRSWQATDNSTNNYYMEPTFHYTVIDEQGNPSTDVVTLDAYDTTTSPWVTLKANKAGTAIVLVTYDAMTCSFYKDATKTDYMNGPLFGAIWPENTGVFVVTVDDGANDITPRMLINTDKDHSAKNAGVNVDAELDVFYYTADQEGASYTFEPWGVSKVEIAHPVAGEEMYTYNGFEEVQASNDEESGNNCYTLLLKNGRNIVRLTDASGNSIYQVLTAKQVDYHLQNVTTGDNTAFNPGDKVSLKFNTLYHPANKLAGVYNMSATAQYGDNICGATNQYAFASTEAAQTISFNLPMSAGGDSYTLSGGCIKVSGYGDPYGNHRLFNKTTGRNANFTAVQRTAYFGQLPVIELPVQSKNIMALISTNIEGASLKVMRSDGSEVSPEDNGTYTLNYYGTYSYVATAEGYGTAYGTFDVYNDEFVYEVTVPEISESTWDGATTSEPTATDGIYQISNGQELAWFAAAVNNNTATSASAVLTQDIDLAGFNWTPIGNATYKFAGTFDGQGHTIRNFYLANSTTNYQGLFGNTSAATIKNVTVQGVINCTGTSSRVGAIAGQAMNGTIENCHNEAAITAYQYVGGIVGYGSGALAINRCSNRGNITGTLLSTTNSWGIATVGSTYVGGIIGYNATATASIKNSYNQGNLSGANYVGGITGYMNNSVTIDHVYNTGNITSTATYTGAIRPATSATANTANVTNAYATIAYFNDVNTTIVTTQQMECGEVAYLLGKPFGQNLVEGDKAPVLDRLAVYAYDGQYTNNNPAWDDIVNFEDNTLAIGETYNGSDLGGGFQSGDYWFENNYDDTYASWNGFALSRTTSSEFNSYADQYNSCTGGGHESTSFAVGYYSEYNYWLYDQAPRIYQIDMEEFEPAYVYVTNTANAVKSMQNGDSYAKKFTDDDWFKLIITGYDIEDNETGSTEFYLAKGTDIVTDWQKVDLSPLGRCTSITFIMDSSDKSWDFMNTPAYFCLDNLKVRKTVEAEAYDLVDKQEYTAEDYTKVNRLTYTRTFGTTKWQPLYVPFESLYDDWKKEDVTVAKASEYDGSRIQIEELAENDIVEANTPYFIRANETGEVTVSVEDATLYPAVSKTVTVEDISFTGTYSAIELEPNTFILHNGAIMTNNNTYTLPSMRWYFSGGLDANSKVSIVFNGDEATGITNADADANANSEAYNLAGQRVTQSAKGIVIVNGKKMIRK